MSKPPLRFVGGREAAAKRLLLFGEPLDTIVYIDGFNLYHGCIQFTEFKWLDIGKMCQLLLPEHKIIGIKYFTARVSGRDDPESPLRQQVYFRALRTIPGLEIIEGHFSVHTKPMLLADHEGMMARVIKTEEKGSDVNIATHLLTDAFTDAMECAVLLSNDSDLVLPVRIVREKLGKHIGLLNPHKYASKQLRPLSHFMKQIRHGVLKASQFPDVLKDAAGEISKPGCWSVPLPHQIKCRLEQCDLTIRAMRLPNPDVDSTVFPTPTEIHLAPVNRPTPP